MNVYEYFIQELGSCPTQHDDKQLMGDEIPLDSNCGNDCKLCIDAAKDLIDELNEGKEYWDCVRQGRYAFIGHICAALGDRDEMKRLREQSDQQDIIEIACHVCEVYIFG